jgi:predicted transposase/invertase (TIGR01784 family)
VPRIIKNEFTARGLKEAGERLDEMKLNEKDAKEYKRYLKNLRDIASEQHTKIADAQELIKQGKRDVARNLKSMGMSDADIAKATGLTEDEISDL